MSETPGFTTRPTTAPQQATGPTNLLRQTRATYWNALGDSERAAAEPSPESLVAWSAAVEFILDLIDNYEAAEAVRRGNGT